MGTPSKKKGIRFYLSLFWATCSVSAFTLGGGYVIVPLLRKKFVEKKQWIQEEEMVDYVAIAQSAPGPIAVNTSMLIGLHLAGLPGALLSVLGTALPPMVIISVVAVVYDLLQENAYIEALMLGMRVGVAAVLVDVVITMVQNILKTKDILSICIMAASFVALYFFKVHILLVFGACVLVGIAATLLRSRKKEGQL